MSYKIDSIEMLYTILTKKCNIGLFHPTDNAILVIDFTIGATPTLSLRLSVHLFGLILLLYYIFV